MKKNLKLIGIFMLGYLPFTLFAGGLLSKANEWFIHPLFQTPLWNYKIFGSLIMVYYCARNYLLRRDAEKEQSKERSIRQYIDDYTTSFAMLSAMWLLLFVYHFLIF